MTVKGALRLGSLTLILVASSACQKAALNSISTAPTPPPAATKNRKGDQNMQELIQKVLAKDPTATLLARNLGRSAAESLKPLAKDEDPVVREIALRCLIESGGDGLASVFANALLDESGSVRGAALAGLAGNPDPSVYPALLNAFDNSSDLPEMREQIALIMGRLDSADTLELNTRLENEKDQLARDGLVAALAKLGDNRSRAQFADSLRNAKGDRLKRFLDYVDFINQEWAARALGPVLLDKTPLLRIGIDGLPNLGPGNLRACDISVNLVAKILKAKFSFPVDMKTQYSDQQLQEVRNYIGSK